MSGDRTRDAYDKAQEKIRASCYCRPYSKPCPDCQRWLDGFEAGMDSMFEGWLTDVEPGDIIWRNAAVVLRAAVCQTKAENARLFAIVARLLVDEPDGGWWDLTGRGETRTWKLTGGGRPFSSPHVEPMDPVDADLIRRAIDHVGGDQ